MKIFTSESVCSGHPDKICDQISDAVLDAALLIDPNSKVAIETMAGKDICILAGEIRSKAKLDYKKIARQTIKSLGYDNQDLGFWHGSEVLTFIHEQSSEIARGVDKMGAGDQGMMYGFACNETYEKMPLPITIAHQIAQQIDQARESGLLTYLQPDGKTQVSVDYQNGKPMQISSVIVAVPHAETVVLDQVKEDIFNQIIIPVLDQFKLPYQDMRFVVNGTGIWHKGGPASDVGLTGRKIIVDTYGSLAKIGGGAFSGKDPTKVDRSGAYAARFIAKNIVAHGLADQAEVRIAYFIGAKEPLMKEVETFGTSHKSEKVIRSFVDKLLDTSVAGIIRELNLLRPIYLQTATYGHFGKAGLPWEKII